MKNHKYAGSFLSSWIRVGQLLVFGLCLCSFGAGATAPRVAPGLFGEEKKADILKYRLPPSNSALPSEGELLSELVTAAFKAAGKTPVLEIQPSRQLAKYALFNDEVVALIGSPQDFSVKNKRQYRLVTFYLRGAVSSGDPVVMIFGKQGTRGDELYQAFNKGLQAILKSGAYQEILERHHGKGKIAADYVGRLQQLNPALK